jgi:hypothetical protein
MKKHATISPHEYKNDFLSIIIRPAADGPPGTFLCCFSINISRFTSLSRGSFGICSNPAFKGLQLLRADVSAFARERGVPSRSADEKACVDIFPRGHGWYHETLLIENASGPFLRELLQFSVMSLVRKVLLVCKPDLKLPNEFPDPEALQKYIESL